MIEINDMIFGSLGGIEFGEFGVRVRGGEDIEGVGIRVLRG